MFIRGKNISSQLPGKDNNGKMWDPDSWLGAAGNHHHHYYYYVLFDFNSGKISKKHARHQGDALKEGSSK